MDRLAQLYDAAWKDGYTDGNYDYHTASRESLGGRNTQAYREGYCQGRNDAQQSAIDFTTPRPESCGNSWGAEC